MLSEASDCFYLRRLRNNFKYKNNQGLNGVAWCPFFLKNTFKQRFSSISKRLLRSWDCIPSGTVDLEKLYHQSSPCAKQDGSMYRKIFDCCFFPGEELIDVLYSALLNAGWAGILCPYLKQASFLSKLCCTIEDLQFSGSLQSNYFYWWSWIFLLCLAFLKPLKLGLSCVICITTWHCPPKILAAFWSYWLTKTDY